MGDPFLNYFALFLLIFVVVVLFYGIIAIHDIPAQIAETRDHPHRDAIHAAGWVSLFTLHVAVAVPLDLGDGVPPRARLGVPGDVPRGWSRTASRRKRAGGLAAACRKLESTIKAGGD